MIIWRKNVFETEDTIDILTDKIQECLISFRSLPKAENLEQNVDDLQTDFINNHIQRLMNNECDPVGGVLFEDMVNDLERCSDHAINIAYALFEHADSRSSTHSDIPVYAAH